MNPELLRRLGAARSTFCSGRSPGGFRLYTDEDAERVARMRRALDEGLSPPRPHAPRSSAANRPRACSKMLVRLLAAIERYDENSRARGARRKPRRVRVGSRPARGDPPDPHASRAGLGTGTLEISQEHFASNLIRGRLLSLARL